MLNISVLLGAVRYCTSLYRYICIVHWTFFVREGGVIICYPSEGMRAFSFVKGNSGTPELVLGGVHFLHYCRFCDVICGAIFHVILRVGV